MIREFQSDDVVPILESANEFDFSGFEDAGVDVDPGVFVGNVINMASAPHCAVYVAIEDEKIVGIIGAVITPSIFSDQTIAAVVFWDVLSGYRGTLGVRLLKKVERWAGDNADIITAANVKGHGPDLDILYDRLGYTEVETHYRKEA